MVIYKITNKVNNKFYIGSAVDFAQRKRKHLSDLKLGHHHSRHLQRSYIKHGIDNFLFEIIETISESNLLIEREQYYLDTLKPFIDSIGYNCTPTAGSSLGIKRSIEFRKKVSIANLGSKHSEERNLGNKQAQTGKHSGALNSAAKTFKFLDPDKTLHIVTGRFISFCKEQNLNKHLMKELKSGIIQEYKGWTLYNEVKQL